MTHRAFLQIKISVGYIPEGGLGSFQERQQHYGDAQSSSGASSDDGYLNSMDDSMSLSAAVASAK